VYDGIELAERFFGAERLNADLRSVFSGLYRPLTSSCLFMRALVCGQQFSVVADTGADKSAMSLPLFRRLQGAPRLQPHCGSVSLFGTVGRAVGKLTISVALQPTVHGVTLYGESLVDFLVVDGTEEAICFGRDLLSDPASVIGFIYQAALRRTGDIVFISDEPSEFETATQVSCATVSLNRIFVPQRDGLLPYLPGDDSLLDRSGAISVMDEVLDAVPSPTDVARTLPSADDIAATVHTSSTGLRAALIAVLTASAGIFGPLAQPEEMTVEPVDVQLTPGSDPRVTVFPYRVHPRLREGYLVALQEGLETGIFGRHPDGYIPETAGCMLGVAKPQGGVRLCFNATQINPMVETKSFVMPDIDQIFDRLRGKRVFSVVDMFKGYFQIPLTQRAQKLFSFPTPFGWWYHRRLPMGYKNAGAEFWLRVYRVLEPLVLEGICFPYLDDVIIASDSEEQHARDVQRVLEALRAAGFRLSITKCRFGLREVAYLGRVTDGVRVWADPARMQGLRDLPEPRSISKLRSALSLFSYYRKFVDHYHVLVQPLLELGRAGTNVARAWRGEHSAAFAALKRAILARCELLLPDYTRQFILRTDACVEGCGAVLLQTTESGEEVPVGHYSYSFRGAQVHWNTTEKEAFALYWALQKLFGTLLPVEFIWETDHRNLTFEDASDNIKVRRWGLFTGMFRFTRRHIPGVDNVVADALSRVLCSGTAAETADAEVNSAEPRLWALAMPSDPTELSRSAAVSTDAAAISARSFLDTLSEQQARSPEASTWTSNSRFERVCVDGRHVWLRDGNFYIPSGATDLIAALTRAAHDYSGHGGTHRTLRRLNDDAVWWPRMSESVKAYVASCPHCQFAKASVSPKPTGTQSPVTPTRRMGTVAVDTCGPLTEAADGSKYIIVCIDLLTRWVELVPSAVNDGDAIASAVKERILTRHGSPDFIICDNGPGYASKVFLELCRAWGAKRHLLLAYRPQGNGVVERVNASVISTLKTLLGNRFSQWATLLPEVQWHLNTARHSAIHMSPYEALYAEPPRTAVSRLVERPASESSASELRERALYVQLRAYLGTAVAQARSAAAANATAVVPVFKPGDRVLLHRPYVAHKLASHWSGPHTIVRRVSDNVYVVRDYVMESEHATHVSRLQRFDMSRTSEEQIAAMNVAEGWLIPLRVLEHRVRNGVLELHIVWIAMDQEEDSWEPASNVEHVDIVGEYLLSRGLSAERVSRSRRPRVTTQRGA
jgi:hypothetical protein